MTERVLAFDPGVVPQEKPWDCGPASAQVILNGRGVTASEDALISEIGTTVNGTNYVGLIERVLNQRLPDANYSSVYLQNDPPTSAQKNQLWADLVRSIDAGYGVVMNWVSPPGNRPRGAKGSQSPAYGGGTIYHYVTAMGYDDAGRYVYIADPGFRPYGYWITFDQCASLIPPKGYAAAAPDSEADPARTLATAFSGGLTLARYRQLLPAVSEALVACGCTTVDRIAMWCAQIGHESGGLYYTEEIASGAAYEGRADLGNVYPGDGVAYKGRSWIQITGRSNYTRLSAWAFDRGAVPTPTYFVEHPTELASDRYAGLGAAWYWAVARPDINALADRRDIVTVTQRINGGLNGLDDRRARYARALALGDQLLQLITTPGEGFMAGLTDAEQKELLLGIRWLREQAGPNKWGPESSFGKSEKGDEMTQRDGLAELKREVEDLKATVDNFVSRSQINVAVSR